MTEVVEILEHARQRIVDRGWLQGGFVEAPNGPCCVSGAVLLEAECTITGFASYGAEYVKHTHPALLEALTELTYPIGGPNTWMDWMDKYRAAPVSVLARWNDDPDRVVADVLDLYDETISRLKEAQT